MKPKEYVEGVKVRISTNLEKTRNRYSTTTTMLNMRGNMYKLEGLSHLKKGGFVRRLGLRYTFDLRDLIVVKKETPIIMKPVTFDPSHLDV